MGVTSTMTILWKYRPAPWSHLTSCGATLAPVPPRTHSCWATGWCQTWQTADEGELFALMLWVGPLPSPPPLTLNSSPGLTRLAYSLWRVAETISWICSRCGIWTSCPTGWQTCPCFHTLTWRITSCPSWLWGSSQVSGSQVQVSSRHDVLCTAVLLCSAQVWPGGASDLHNKPT